MLFCIDWPLTKARKIGVQGFIHVASPLGDFADVDSAITIGVSGGLNALKACAKTASITRFVFTSSSLAATFPKADVEFAINGNSYNDEALQVMREDPTRPGLFKYAAMKSETEKAMWKWMQENKPEFTLNTIVSSPLRSASIVWLILLTMHRASKCKLRAPPSPAAPRLPLDHRLGPRRLDRRVPD